MTARERTNFWFRMVGLAVLIGVLTWHIARNIWGTSYYWKDAAGNVYKTK